VGDRPSTDDIFSEVTAKRSALVDGQVMAAARGTNEPNDPASGIDAASSFRLAESALQRNDFVAAEQHASKALAGDPTQPDYMALFAWIRTLGGAPTDEAIRTMSKVLIEDPSNEKALFYRGKLLVKKNRLPEALNDFTELLSANPNHQEAQAEVRELQTKLPSY
jgi:cytochrome c-type biogenesis protein CcmH/NrfG